MKLTAIRTMLLALAALLAVQTTPADAQFLSQWRIVAAGQPREVGNSELLVTPVSDWNRSTNRPTRYSEAWTQDGMALNELDFIVALKEGKPLFRERNRRRDPLPKFDADFLPTDIAEFFENSAQVALGGSLFTVTEVRPAQLAGYPGVHFAYTYTGGDNVDRRGEVRAAIIDKKLYLINFDAPRIHYFDASIGEVRQMMDGAQFRR